MITSSLQQLPIIGVSHNPEIKKQVMIPNGIIPNITNFSQSTFLPGQVCHAHTHPDMWEIYLVEAGVLRMTCRGEITDHPTGSCVIIEPGEEHSAANRGDDNLTLTYFGVIHADS